MHILLLETGNYPSSISRRERITIKIFHDQPPQKNVAGPSGDRTHHLLITSWWHIWLSHRAKHKLTVDYLRQRIEDDHNSSPWAMLRWAKNTDCHLLQFCLALEGLTLVLLNQDIPFLCKQCISRSVCFWRSQLKWICTVCHSVCDFISTTWIK